MTWLRDPLEGSEPRRSRAQAAAEPRTLSAACSRTMRSTLSRLCAALTRAHTASMPSSAAEAAMGASRLPARGARLLGFRVEPRDAVADPKPLTSVHKGSATVNVLMSPSSSSRSLRAPQ